MPEHRNRGINGNNLAAIATRAVSAASVFSVYSAVAMLLLFSATAAAQTPEENSPDQSTPQPSQTPRSSQWQWSFSLRNRTGFRLDKPRVLQMSRNIFDARGIYKINPDWRITVEARAHYDPVNRLGFPRGVWVDPRQAIIDGKVGKLDLRLGLQQVVWGESDGLRVLDIINPLDYREFILEDFLDSRRPLWAARADAPIAGGSLQMIYAPYFAPGRLPGPDAEFGLGDPFGVALIGAAIGDGGPLPFTIRSENTARPGYRLSSGQGGARFRRSLGAWDVTANYYYGWEDIPTSYLGAVTLEPGTALPVITLRPRYDRKEVFGLTGTTNFGPVVVRAEAGWNRLKPAPVNNDADGDGFERLGQFSGVAGLDYSPREWVWLSGQYFLQFASAPQANLLFPRYNHLASFFVRTNFFREKFRPELFILTGLNQRQYMIRPRFMRTIGDHWSIGFGADFLGGRPITGFGYFGSRDRIVVELKRAW